MAQTYPTRSRCATCGHTLTFHPQAGPCRANMCPAGCTAFKPAPEQETLPSRPDRDELGAALNALTATIEYAPPAARTQAATHLLAALSQLPLTRKAPGYRDVIRRLKTCRDQPTTPQDAEVANHDDAQDGPAPD